MASRRSAVDSSRIPETACLPCCTPLPTAWRCPKVSGNRSTAKLAPPGLRRHPSGRPDLRMIIVTEKNDPESRRDKVPRDAENDYNEDMAQRRRDFASEHCGTALEHVGRYSLDPATVAGNVENFFGVAQVPMGLAGPLLMRGDHAQGNFYVPMATTEGTLVASYK